MPVFARACGEGCKDTPPLWIYTKGTKGVRGTAKLPVCNKQHGEFEVIINLGRTGFRLRWEQVLAAARSRSRSNSPPDCYSLRSRRFATPPYKPLLISLGERGFAYYGKLRSDCSKRGILEQIFVSPGRARRPSPTNCIPSVILQDKMTAPLATRGAFLCHFPRSGEIDGFRGLWKQPTH